MLATTTTTTTRTTTTVSFFKSALHFKLIMNIRHCALNNFFLLPFCLTIRVWGLSITIYFRLSNCRPNLDGIGLAIVFVFNTHCP